MRVRCAGTSKTCCVAVAQSLSGPTTSKPRKFGRPSICRRRGRAAMLRDEFLTDLHRRLAAQQDGAVPPAPHVECDPQQRHRRHVGRRGGCGGGGIHRSRVDRWQPRSRTAARELTPNSGRWMRVAASADVTDGVMRPFDVGSVIGFVRRVNGKTEAVSGVCTHQGCRLWFDAPDDRLRCPCHSTSFAPAGQVLTHQLPIAPKPLPTLMVREENGAVEVFVPAPGNEPA